MQNIRTSLNKLKTTQELTIKSTHQYTLVTIENYDLYQLDTTQLTNNLTNEQQTTNKRLTTNEKRKKDNKEKNIRFLDFNQNTNEDLNNLYEN